MFRIIPRHITHKHYVSRSSHIFSHSHTWERAIPAISNHTETSEDSVAMTPTMCATGSFSITEKVKGLSSKSSGAASAGNFGLGIHSMCSRQVEDF